VRNSDAPVGKECTRGVGKEVGTTGPTGKHRSLGQKGADQFEKQKARVTIAQQREGKGHWGRPKIRPRPHARNL